MITQDNLRSVLPGKIVRTVSLLAERSGIPNMEALRKFYHSETYRNLEREETKYWWMSPQQVCDSVVLSE